MPGPIFSKNDNPITFKGENGVSIESPKIVDFIGATAIGNPLNDGAVVTITNGSVNIAAFGAKGDGVQLEDWSCNLTGIVSSPSVVFGPGDIGKTVSISDGVKDHILGNIVSIDIIANTAQLDNEETSNVVGELGSYGTDNIKPLQDAFNYGIQNNVLLKADAGTFLIGDTNPDNITFHDVRLLFTEEGQNFHLTGAGKGLTIFRELDGKTKRIGRYTTLFLCQMPSFGIGHVNMEGFTMDKNGRSLLETPIPLYDLEQAHCIKFGKVASDRYIWQSVLFRNIEIYDKIGGGISWSVSNVKVLNIIAENITEQKFGGIGGAVEYGQRADVEIHAISDNFILQNCKIRYCQYEPSGAYATSANNPRVFKLINCEIDDFEPTEITNDADLAFGRVEMINCKVKSFTPRGLPTYVTGGEVTINTTINSTKARFKGVTVKLPYDAVGNTVQTLSFANYPGIKNRWILDDCDFEIDSPDSAILPLGYAMTNGGSLTDLEQNNILIRNSRFDKRFNAMLDAQNNGTWAIENCLLAGKLRVALIGATSIYNSLVTFKNNDYSQLADGVATFLFSNGNTNYRAAFYEEVAELKWQTGQTGSGGTVDDQITRQVIRLVDAIGNRSGYCRKGETFKIIGPAPGTYSHYVCTTSGAGLASVVKGYGLLEA